MKGKLILTPVKEPKEGMKVVVDLISANHIAEITHLRPQGDEYSDIRYKNGKSFYSPHSQLQQIAVEYRLYKNKNTAWATSWCEELLVHPNDYKYAISHIGEEVEFNMLPEYVYDFEKIDAEILPFARLIKSTSPIVYTEEEARKRAEDSWNAYHHNNTFEEWWEENKKK